jgi:hypothetical protein
MIKVFVPASKLAAALGRNPYVPYQTALRDVWKQNFKDQYAAALERVRRGSKICTLAPADVGRIAVSRKREAIQKAISTENDDERLLQVEAIKDETSQLFDDIAQDALKSAARKIDSRIVKDVVATGSLESISDAARDRAARARVASLCDTVEDALAAFPEAAGERGLTSAQDLSAVADALDEVAQRASDFAEAREVAMRDSVSMVQVRRGSRDERKAIAQVQSVEKVVVRDSNAKMYYATVSSDDGEFEVVVGGRVDGWSGDDEIVELKVRQKRLFRQMREYETIQVQAYLRLTGAQRCRFAEKFGDDMWSCVIERDDAWWDGDAREGLLIMARDVLEISQDVSRQDRLASMG